MKRKNPKKFGSLKTISKMYKRFGHKYVHKAELWDLIIDLLTFIIEETRSEGKVVITNFGRFYFFKERLKFSAKKSLGKEDKK